MTGIKRIAIIGAGPTGVACARYLRAENVFECIDIFEQRDTVGGIWNLSVPVASKQIPIPQMNPSYGAVKSRKSDKYHGDHDQFKEETSLEFESPLYDYLETNIPKTMMAFSDHPFRLDLPLYPGHAEVHKYLEDDAASVWHLIRFQTQVIDVHVRRSTQHSPDSQFGHIWRVTTKDLSDLSITSRLYDAVVFANGHYTVPHIPELPGIAAWNKKYPHIIIHSKAYRKPEDFKNKRVLVVGNSASGLDIAAQMAPFVRQPLYLASRSNSQLAPSGGGPQWREDIGEIDKFIIDDDHDRSVQSKDGKVISHIDAVVFATGYFYSFPFIPSSNESLTSTYPEKSTSNSSTSSTTPEQSDGENEEHLPPSSLVKDPLRHLTTSGLRTHDVYQHFLHIEYPTLALPVLNLKIVPFPLSENQAAVIARLWSGRLNMPSKAEMRQWEQDEQQMLCQVNRLRPAPTTASGDQVTTNSDKDRFDLHYEGDFHTLVYPEDAKQINTLYDWAASARPRTGLENNGVGKLGTCWKEAQVWLRGQFPNLKAAYGQQGDARFAVRSLDDLGQDWDCGFEKWKESTSEEEQKSLFIAAATPGWI